MECFRNGAISEAVILVNGESAFDGFREAKRNGLPLGVHLNLTEGRPLSKNAKTIVNAEGSSSTKK